MSQNLLFLPGAGADPNFWRPLGERLPASWTKTYLGWPGIGNQEPNPKINGFEDLVGLVESFLGDTPVDLLAQSMGGAVALQVALKHPTKVRRLVLAATSGGLDVASLGASDWRPAYRTTFPNAAAWITETRPDLSADIPRITQPTLLLWGDADPISPVAVGQKLWQLLPQATLSLVAGGDHSFVQERPADIAELIRSHLE